MDKNTHYFVCTGDYLLDNWYDLQDYLYNTLKPSNQYQSSAPVKTSKLVAKKLGLRSTRADTVIVDENTKIQLEKQFNFADNNFGVLRVADFA